MAAFLPSTLPQTMKAVVIKSPYKVAVENRPVPEIVDETDVVVKVSMSALCGSDLHIYRGHQPLPSWDFVMGHELTGTVVLAGKEVKRLKVGDRIVSPFTTHCSTCYHCTRSLTSRCEKGKLFGSPALDGGQAEYVRVPLADSTLTLAPDDVPDESLILLADILPTGLYCARNAWDMLNDAERAEPTTAVVVGCGPVGLCAITAASELFTHVIAIDGVPARLSQAQNHGATHVVQLELPSSSAAKAATGTTTASAAAGGTATAVTGAGEAGQEAKTAEDGAKKVVEKVKELTGRRLADAVLELVGNASALQLAIDCVRVGGVVSVQGLHTHRVEVEGLTVYNKNLRFQFGRCPAGALLPPALAFLRRTLMTRPGVMESFVQRRARLSEAEECYEVFERQGVGKVVFVGP